MPGRGMNRYSLAAMIRVSDGHRLLSGRRESVLRWCMSSSGVHVEAGPAAVRRSSIEVGGGGELGAWEDKAMLCRCRTIMVLPCSLPAA